MSSLTLTLSSKNRIKKNKSNENKSNKKLSLLLAILSDGT